MRTLDLTSILNAFKSGANVHQFRETKSTSSRRRKFEANYYPELFGDGEFEYQRRQLLRRLFEETQAAPKDLQHYLNNYEQTVEATGTQKSGEVVVETGDATSGELNSLILISTNML